MPTKFAGNCVTSTGSEIFDTASSDQVECIGSTVPDADALLYIQYSNSTGSENYYTNTLLSANSMSQNQGTCSTVTLGGSTSSGTYCEESVSFSTSGSSATTQGREFLFVGTKFNLGSNTDVANYCGSAGTGNGFTAFGWTDDSANLTAVALACNQNSTTATAIHSDFVNGTFSLGA
jgi:hypothetical protein